MPPSPNTNRRSPYVTPLQKMSMFNQLLTRGEFNTAFQNVARLVRAAEENLIALINARLANVKDGRTPTRDELLSLIQPLIPKLKDGETPSDERLRALITPLIPKPIDGEDGKDADEDAILSRIEANLPQLGAAIRDGLELLQGKDRISVSAIEGLDELLAQYAKTVFNGYGPGGGTSFSLLQSGALKVQQPTALNFKGGGAPTISHNQNGTTDLTFPAGGLTRLAATETPNASNRVFTFSQKPTFIVSDAGWYEENTGWTWNSSTLQATMSVPPQTSIFGFV